MRLYGYRGTGPKRTTRKESHNLEKSFSIQIRALKPPTAQREDTLMPFSFFDIGQWFLLSFLGGNFGGNGEYFIVT
jgi:hypothetical protein